jgi:hypothetical protein
MTPSVIERVLSLGGEFFDFHKASRDEKLKIRYMLLGV